MDLAALLHDIDDWKYQTEDGPSKRAETFLRSQSVPETTVMRVMEIIDSMGFKEELGGAQVRSANETAMRGLIVSALLYSERSRQSLDASRMRIDWYDGW